MYIYIILKTQHTMILSEVNKKTMWSLQLVLWLVAKKIHVSWRSTNVCISTNGYVKTFPEKSGYIRLLILHSRWMFLKKPTRTKRAWSLAIPMTRCWTFP